jgi:ABC-type multidrug transport system fused ATPase/permease subunit
LLFGTTVRENIGYGKLDATMEEIVAAAKAANAHDFITEMENDYETVISERGANLSGGQRQRIAIARTFIRNVPILILDEPMTGLDVESESAVRDALDRLMENKTCILITHDLQSAAEADRILLLNDGRITDQGTHADLLVRSSAYRELWRVKTSEGHTHSPAPGLTAQVDSWQVL